MNKFKGFLPLFSVSLATLVFYAHMLIPHDHHLSDSDASSDQTCPLSDNTSGRHSRFPMHCHAFNDLTSEKAINLIIIKSIKSLDSEPILQSNSSDINIQLFVTGQIFLSVQTVNSGMLELTFLRAPPSLA